MKYALVLILAILGSLIHAQATQGTIDVIARRTQAGKGNGMRTAEFEVLKVLKGRVSSGTVKVGYDAQNEYKGAPDTVLLHLDSVSDPKKPENYFIFPNYNAQQGIEPVQLSFVDASLWEACETGQGTCEPLRLVRNTAVKHWYLLMPCGGTSTNVRLTPVGQTQPIQKTIVTAVECPPVFDLSRLPDGKYTAYMLACNLGGGIEIHLSTRH